MTLLLQHAKRSMNEKWHDILVPNFRDINLITSDTDRHGCPSSVDIQRGLKVSRRNFEKSTISVIKNALKQSLVYIVQPVSYTVTLF